MRPTRLVSGFVSFVTLFSAAAAAPLAGCGGDDSSPAAPGQQHDQQDASAICPGATMCGDRCVDLQLDPRHCGACDKTCSATQMCAAGACVDDDASLSALSFSSGALSPAFSPTTTVYTLTASSLLNLHLTAAAASTGATLTLNGAPLSSGAASERIVRAAGDLTPVVVQVTSASGSTKSYAIAVLPAQSVYVKASNTGTTDLFGYSVAISGDTVAVGAPHEASSATGIGGNQTNDSASNSGAVYVFARLGGIWSQQAYVKASNTGAGDYFGYSVALEGDTLAVGAPYEASSATGINGVQTNNSAGYSGAVYVFTRSGATWSQQAYVKASNTGTEDEFGSAVALSGDTLVVGAPHEGSNAKGVNGDQANNSANGSGAVYVFTRSGATWSQQAYVKASNTDVGDSFGYSVAVSGDTLAAGALSENSKATGVNGDQTDNSLLQSGAAYVFARSGGVWSQQAYLKASNPGSGDFFGYSVAVSGDTVAVGAPNESSKATGVNGEQDDDTHLYSGAVYVFARSGGAWSQQAYIKALNSWGGANFGHALALSGNTLAVGAWFESSNAVGVNGDGSNRAAGNSGAAYVFAGAGGVWSQQAFIKASNTGLSDQFGASVALAGDELAVGAPDESSSATGIGGNQANDSALAAGAVYVMP